MALQFNYTISTGTLNGKVAVGKLENEIRATTIPIALSSISINTTSDSLVIDFKDDLISSDVTILDNLIAAHDGQLSIDDPTRMQLVDGNNNPVGSVDDNGTKRLAFDFGGSNLTGPQGAQGDAGPTGAQGPAGSGSGYGAEYQYDSSDGQSSTTSGSFQNKLKLTTGSLVGGLYKIDWYYECKTSDNDSNYRVQIDSTNTVHEIEHTSVDEGDKSYWTNQGGFVEVNLTAGVHVIDLDYNDDGGGTAYIRRARLCIKAVS